MPKRKTITNKPTPQNAIEPLDNGTFFVATRATETSFDFTLEEYTNKKEFIEKIKAIPSLNKNNELVVLFDHYFVDRAEGFRETMQPALLQMLLAYNLVPGYINTIIIAPTYYSSKFLEPIDGRPIKYLIEPYGTSTLKLFKYRSIIPGEFIFPEDATLIHNAMIYSGFLSPTIASYLLRKHIASIVLNICYLGGLQEGCMWFDALDKISSPGILEKVISGFSNDKLSLPNELTCAKPFAKWREETLDLYHRTQKSLDSLTTHKGTLNRQQCGYSITPYYMHSIFDTPYPFLKFKKHLDNIHQLVTNFSQKLNITDVELISKTIELEGNFVDNCLSMIKETGADEFITSYLEGVPLEDII